MPSWRGSRRYPKLSRGSYHLQRPDPFRTNWAQALALIAVTIWSCYDGEQSLTMVLVAVVGTVALVQVISLLFTAARPTRMVQAVYSGTVVMFLMPVWDWLSRQWAYPESLWTALGFGAFFGAVRYAFTPRGPSRPPS